MVNNLGLDWSICVDTVRVGAVRMPGNIGVTLLLPSMPISTHSRTRSALLSQSLTCELVLLTPGTFINQLWASMFSTRMGRFLGQGAGLPGGYVKQKRPTANSRRAHHFRLTSRSTPGLQ